MKNQVETGFCGIIELGDVCGGGFSRNEKEKCTRNGYTKWLSVILDRKNKESSE